MFKSLLKLFRWSKKYKWWLMLTIGLGILLEVTYSFVPVLVSYAIAILDGDAQKSVNLPPFIIDWVRSANGLDSKVLIIALAIAILQTIRFTSRFFYNFLQGKTSNEVSYDMRVSLYDHIQSLPYSYHNGADKGDLIQRCTSDIDTSSGFVAKQVPQMIAIISMVIAGAYQMYQISSVIMFIGLAIVPISFTASFIYFRYVHKAFKHIEELEAKMITVIQENVASARVVRAFANEQFEMEKLTEKHVEYNEACLRFNRVMSIFWGVMDFLCFLQCAIILLTCIFFAKEGSFDVSDITTVVMLQGLLIWPMRGLGRMISDFGRAVVASNRIYEILEIASEFQEDGTAEPPIKGDISFENVSFAFPDEPAKLLLKNISFSVKAGQTVALVGKTGCGKSTICNLLTRMLDYTSGDVYIDGVKLKDIKKKYLRDKVRIVLQDPFLYSKSIYENISIVNRNSPEERVYDAARKAAIHNDIVQFEKGYQTLVGEKGATLSGGQKQRIAIARVLVSDAPVVIFDDSLSAIDTETDLMIRTALRNNPNKVTTFIITHRTTTAKEADVIIVLENGEISNIGTHEELVSREGLYKKLWGIQGSLEKEFLEYIRLENSNKEVK